MSDAGNIKSNKVYNILASPAHDLEFLTKEKFAVDQGLKVRTIQNWMTRHWQKGKHYIVIGHTTLLHKQTVNLWIKERFLEGLTNTTEKSESAMPSTRKRSISARATRNILRSLSPN